MTDPSNCEHRKPSGEGLADLAEPAPTVGGLGSVFTDDNKYAVRKDVGLTARAVRERWKIPAGAETDLPAHMVNISLNSDDDRVRVAAAGVVVKMMGQNQADEHLAHKTTPDGEEKSTIRVVFENRLKASGEQEREP